jgi:hypothetical protein
LGSRRGQLEHVSTISVEETGTGLTSQGGPAPPRVSLRMSRRRGSRSVPSMYRRCLER